MAARLPVARSLSAGVFSEGGAAGFCCEVCGKQFKSRRSLNNHRQVHEGRTVCPICSVVYSTAHNLRAHLFAQHRVSAEEVLRLVPRRMRGRC